MVNVRDNICQIIGATLFDQSVPSFNEADWSAIYKEFLDQAIVAIPASILEKLPISAELNQQWSTKVMTSSAAALRLIANQDKLIQLLKQSNIPYAILKGTAAAIYYPTPWLRTMGDVDIIVRPENYDQTRELMLANGFASMGEDDNPRHEAFELNNTQFELHRYFSVEAEDSVLDELIYEQLDHTVEATVFDYSFRMLPEPLNGIILVQHIKQHLKTGLGLRQMIDWFVYVKDHLNDEKWPAFKAVADKVGLTTLSKVATRIGQLYFGLDANITWCVDADEGVCADVMDFIFRSGNFGRKDYENIRGSYVLGKLRKNVFATLQEAGKHNWKALKKYPWLEPVAWLYQIFRYARQGLGSVGKIGVNQKRSMDMDELMERLK